MSSQLSPLRLACSKARIARYQIPLLRLSCSPSSTLCFNFYQLSTTRHGFSTVSSGKKSVALTLYRQLLRWCDSTDEDIPLSFYIPPIYMRSPLLHDLTLASLAADSFVDGEDDKHGKVDPSIMPPNTIIDLHQLTCTVRNSSDARAFFRAIFRINASETNPESQKEQISFAFEGLKSLNELSQALDELKEARKSHYDRENVQYRVGQVVRHKIEHWRGVIVGWTKDTNEAQSEQPSSSLTKKNYKLDPSDRVKYFIVLDSGDANLHFTKRREQGDFNTSESRQSDLSLVTDTSLCRIRSTQISDHFSHFDPGSNSFVLNEMKSYEFPLDQLSDSERRSSKAIAEQSSASIITGVKEVVDYISETIHSLVPDAHKIAILNIVLERLKKISSGDVVSKKQRLSSSALPVDKLACMYIHTFLELVTDVGELLSHRRQSKESGTKIKFAMGDVVQHKVYGFRGVIVAWDPNPSVDVSRWDGLQHITNPESFPFYHIIPDQRDCVNVFGGERPSRYVCEENLELCLSDRRNVEVDLEPQWELNQETRSYVPPADIKFKHGEDSTDDDLTERCLIEIKDALSQLLVSSRDGKQTGNLKLNSAASKLSMNNLLELLRAVDSMNDAAIISELVKEVWKAHVNDDVRWKFDKAVGQLLNGDAVRASESFRELLDEDPKYAEAWNKKATCEFMIGNVEASRDSARKALEIIPTHFQALNGLGLVHYESKDIHSAVRCFQESIELDPWSPVSSRLAACLDTLESSKKGHEEQIDPDQSFKKS